MLKNLSIQRNVEKLVYMRVIALNFNANKFERQTLTVQKLVLARGLQCRYESAPKWSRPVCGTGLGHLTPFFVLLHPYIGNRKKSVFSYSQSNWHRIGAKN
jgi:hypothetical protein